MSDETPKKPEDAPAAAATGNDAGGDGATGGAAPSKPGPTDEEKAAKIAAAKAKAAAKKKAEQDDGPPPPPWEAKPVPPERTDAADDPDVAALAAAIDGAVLSAERFAGDVTVRVPATKIVEICSFFETDRDFTFLVDLTAVDWLDREDGRFDIVYWMHRFADQRRLRLLAAVAEDQVIESVSSVWKTADWMEREVFDLYGVTFANHPNLERILTWEGFNGHPLRKDFPVEGIDTGAAIYPDVYPEGGGPENEPEKDGAKGGAA